MDLASIGSGSLNLFVIIFLIILFFTLIIALFYFYTKWKRYQQFHCIIWEHDGFGNIIESLDTAGIFLDKKSNYKLLFLKKGNIGLDPNNIPYIQSGKIKKIYLRKYGLKNYAFIKPILTEKNTNLMIGEQDLNWMANAFEKLKALLMDKGWLQWMPFIMIAFVTVAIMVIFVYFFKNLDKLQAFGQSLVEASKILKGGTL